MVDMVNAKVGKRELLEDAEAIVGTLLLCVGRIDEQAVNLVDHLGRLDCHLVEREGFVHILRMTTEGRGQEQGKGNQSFHFVPVLNDGTKLRPYPEKANLFV